MKILNLQFFENIFVNFFICRIYLLLYKLKPVSVSSAQRDLQLFTLFQELLLCALVRAIATPTALDFLDTVLEHEQVQVTAAEPNVAVDGKHLQIEK
jgi:hypothetical protein